MLKSYIIAAVIYSLFKVVLVSISKDSTVKSLSTTVQKIVGVNTFYIIVAVVSLVFFPILLILDLYYLCKFIYNTKKEISKKNEK